jgi:hypothetical protein
MQALKPTEIYILRYALICEMRKVEKLQHLEAYYFLEYDAV